mmetsp:Transcript_37136/g.27449  ORF Transcript_37136/g.27449 Transcript_37136/m.27449 type:complete len:347 (-) Transcript_37136:77-1117(-)
MSVRVISDASTLSNLQRSGAKVVLFFWAPWHEPSKLGGQLHDILSALSQKYASIAFATVEAEAVPELSEKFEVAVVPTFVALNGVDTVEKLEGANPSDINQLVKKLSTLSAAVAEPGSNTNASASVTKSPEELQQELNQRLTSLINTATVMLFMKGKPSEPRCGFSRKIVELLNNADIPFASFDILQDEAVRQGLKTFSDWPTYPQLYVRGSLVGGLDIVQEMASTGNLRDQLQVQDLQAPPPPPSLQDRIKSLITKEQVMLFMKGKPSEPRCGFSRKIVEILQENGISFGSFDILQDEDIRQGLKEYSDWPTYPQLYVNGVLAGGLDIVKEMSESGDLKNQLGLM